MSTNPGGKWAGKSFWPGMTQDEIDSQKKANDDAIEMMNCIHGTDNPLVQKLAKIKREMDGLIKFIAEKPS